MDALTGNGQTGKEASGAIDVKLCLGRTFSD
jgi:hypothetical protein